jgi:peptide/nickel transport system ATP-binding protein
MTTTMSKKTKPPEDAQLTLPEPKPSPFAASVPAVSTRDRQAREPGDYVVKVEGLCVERRTPRGWLPLLQDVNFELPRGCCAFFVGPSGAGKSLLLRCILGLLNSDDWRLAGHISLAGACTGPQNLLRGGQYQAAGYQAVRGHSLAAIFQEPTTSLHPSLTVGRQLLEVIPGADHREREAKARAALQRVRLFYPDALRRYPHQFSQGERQRICIAMALCVGGLVLADEPTASLDPKSVGDVMQDLRALRDSDHLDAFVVVTHQPDVIHALYQPSDRFLVLDKVTSTSGSSAHVVAGLPPQGPEGLHDCFRLQVPARRQSAKTPEVLSVKGLTQKLRQGWFRPSVTVIENAAFDVTQDQMVGIIGASGSGKTTLARALIRLLDNTSGDIQLRCPDGQAGEWHNLRYTQPNGSEQDTPAMRQQRRNIQYISQEAATVFNPGMRIGEILAETLALDGTPSEAARTLLAALCRRLGLADGQEAMQTLFDRYAWELSGGQKQRLALLRALLRQPRLIVADEPFTGQDLRTTSEILGVMDDVRREAHVGVVLISHDHNLVERACDQVYRLEEKKLKNLAAPREKQERSDGTSDTSIPG